MRHERPDLLRVPGDQDERVDGAAAPANRSTGPASSAAISRCRSSACSSGVVSAAPSVRLLRSDPRGSYVTTVRSVKCPASVPKPAAPIGDPMSSSTGSAPASLLRTS